MQFRFTYYIYMCVCIKYFKNLTGTAAILIARCLNATVNYVLHRLLNLVRTLLFCHDFVLHQQLYSELPCQSSG